MFLALSWTHPPFQAQQVHPHDGRRCRGVATARERAAKVQYRETRSTVENSPSQIPAWYASSGTQG